MKRTFLSLCLLVAFFALSLPFIYAQDGGQRLSVSQGEILLGEFTNTGGAAAVTQPFPLRFASLDALTATIPNEQCDGRLNVNCGWYKAFWIFGDGNYLKFDDDVIGMDQASLVIRSYDYGRNGTYQPVVYLTEKYHNDNPPEAARATLNVNRATPSGVVTELTRRLANDNERRLDIDYNHPLRTKYPVNFVLSYKKDGLASHVLLFYNGLNDGTKADLMTYDRSEKPAYFPDNYLPGNTPADPAFSFSQGTILAPLFNKYKNALLYDVREFSSDLAEGLTEMRVFPVFNVHALNDLPGGRIPEKPASFTAVLVGTKPVNDDDPAYGQLSERAKVILDASNLALGGQSSLFLRDIQTIDLQIQKSHDPNNLTVVDIRDAGNGQYRVYFRLVVCNQGPAPEPAPALNFHDLTGGHYSAKPELTGLDNIGRVWSAAAPWKVTLPGFQISGSWSEGHPSCREIFFNMLTDQTGLERLYQRDPRALEVCVEFSSGAGECSLNEPLSRDAFKKDGKYLPDNAKERVETPDASWLWGLLLILLLLILWYWYKRRDD